MVKVADYINKERIIFFKKGSKKESIINKLTELVSTSDKVQDKESFKKDIWERETLMSTGIGLGIAIPHARSEYIKDIVIAIGISKESIEFDSIDGKPVTYIIMIAANKNQHKEYLQILAKVALVLKSKKKREKIMNSNSIEDIYEIFSQI